MAGKTPHGARPNRGTTSVDARVLRAKADERTARPKFPGRSLDPVSNAGARGMIVSRKGTEFGLRPTAALFRLGLYASIPRHGWRRLHRIPPNRRAHPARRTSTRR